MISGVVVIKSIRWDALESRANKTYQEINCRVRDKTKIMKEYNFIFFHQ